jgi:hypothetical protein
LNSDLSFTDRGGMATVVLIATQHAQGKS